MSPKFIEVTLFNGSNKIMVNPRRVNSFFKRVPPTQQPEMDCGTIIQFGRGESLYVKETVSQIKTLLNK